MSKQINSVLAIYSMERANVVTDRIIVNTTYGHNNILVILTLFHACVCDADFYSRRFWGRGVRQQAEQEEEAHPTGSHPDPQEGYTERQRTWGFKDQMSCVDPNHEHPAV